MCSKEISNIVNNCKSNCHAILTKKDLHSVKQSDLAIQNPSFRKIQQQCIGN